MALVGQIIASTKRVWHPRLVDNVLTGTPLLEQMNSLGKISFDSGRQIVMPILRATPAGGNYIGMEPPSYVDNEEVDAAVYDWRQYRATPAISGIDLFKNQGSAGVIKLWNAKIDAAAMKINEDITSAMFADPTTADTTRDILPIEQIIDDGNTYTIGGLTSDDVSRWQGQAVVAGGANPLTLTMVETAYMNATEGRIEPTTIVFSKAGYAKFWSLVQTNQRYMGADKKVGFQNLLFNNATVHADSHILTTGGNYTLQRCYVLNLNHLHLVAGEGAWFEVEEKPLDADGYACHIKTYVALAPQARWCHASVDNFTVT